MRLAAAIGVIAVAFAAALYVHQRHPVVSRTGMVASSGTRNRGSVYAAPTAETTVQVRTHPSWEDPAAVLLAIGGIAVAVAIVAYRNPRYAKAS